MGKSLKVWTLLALATVLVGCRDDTLSPTPQSDTRHPGAQEKPVDREPPISADFEQFAKERSYNPHAHREVLKYFRKLWAGEPRDAAFEAKSLSKDLDFKLLNFAELVVSMSRELDMPVSEAVEFVSISTSTEPLPEGVLTRKVADGAYTHSEEERARKLLSEEDTKDLAVLPIMEPLDRVESLMKFCVAIEAWCRKDKPSRFPSLAVVDFTAPPHMQKRHPIDIRHYRERRKALGKPWEEATASAVFKYVAYEVKSVKKRDLAPDKITRTTNLRTDLGLDDLDVVELLLGLEDHYDALVRFEDSFNPITVGAVIDMIDKKLPSGKMEEGQ